MMVTSCIFVMLEIAAAFQAESQLPVSKSSRVLLGSVAQLPLTM
jgi:hypothetical protein